jgi:cytochrome c oxidase subunit II
MSPRQAEVGAAFGLSSMRAAVANAPLLRRLLGALPLALLALAALTPLAFADAWSPESGGSPNADDIDTLYWVTMAVALVVFFGVEAILFYSLYKFKARKGAVAAQIRGNTRLEIGWTVGAALILVVLAVFTFTLLDDIRNPPDSDEGAYQASNGSSVLVAAGPNKPVSPSGRQLEIDVNGQQYLWRYTYPDGDRNPLNDVFSYEEMVVPVGTTVVLSIRAQDVAHSWWIPKLGGKADAVPGYTNFAWFKIPPEQEGTVFTGQCAELCGRNHANMTARVKAVSVEDFEAFLAGRRREIDSANQTAQQQREQLERARTGAQE